MDELYHRWDTTMFDYRRAAGDLGLGCVLLASMVYGAASRDVAASTGASLHQLIDRVICEQVGLPSERCHPLGVWV